MSKILPYSGNYLPFASNQDTNKRTVYGASKDTPVYSDTLNGNMVPAYYQGWYNASTPPPMQWFNGALFTATLPIAYMFQRLALPWVTGQEKYVGDLVRGSDDKTYKCLIDNTTVDPVGDLTSTWVLYGLDDFVALTGNQTIAGIKTFTSSPEVPTATTGLQAVNLDQLNSAVEANQLIIWPNYESEIANSSSSGAIHIDLESIVMKDSAGAPLPPMDLSNKKSILWGFNNYLNPASGQSAKNQITRNNANGIRVSYQSLYGGGGAQDTYIYTTMELDVVGTTETFFATRSGLGSNGAHIAIFICGWVD